MADLQEYLDGVDIDLDNVDLMRARIRPNDASKKQSLSAAVRKALKGAPKSDITASTVKTVSLWLENQLAGKETTTKVLEAGYSSAVSALKRQAVSVEVVQVEPGSMATVWKGAEKARQKRAERPSSKKSAKPKPRKKPIRKSKKGGKK